MQRGTGIPAPSPASPQEEQATRALATAVGLVREEEYDRAERLLRTALDAVEGTVHAVKLLAALSDVYKVSGRNADAQKALQRAIEVYEAHAQRTSAVNQDKEQLHMLKQELVKLKAAAGGAQVEEAERMAREELQALRRRGGSSPAEASFALAWSDVLAGILLQQGKGEAAEVILRASLQSLRVMMAQLKQLWEEAGLSPLAEGKGSGSSAGAGAGGAAGAGAGAGASAKETLPPAVQRATDAMTARMKIYTDRGTGPSDEERQADMDALRSMAAAMSEEEQKALAAWMQGAMKSTFGRVGIMVAQASMTGLAVRMTLQLAEALCLQAHPVEVALAGAAGSSAAALPRTDAEVDAVLAKGAEGRFLRLQLIARSAAMRRNTESGSKGSEGGGSSPQPGPSPLLMAIAAIVTEVEGRSAHAFAEPPAAIAQRGRDALQAQLKKQQQQHGKI